MDNKKQKICPICNKKLTFLKQTLKDGVKVCSNHVVIEAGLLLKETIEQSTVEDIKERIELVKAANEESQKEVENGFSTESTPGNRGAGLNNILTSVLTDNKGTIHIHSNKGII
ncbi:hypothetical protein PZE06_23245, partial [Robertmurraya sp. DFI.2.37]|nr:hypothetical protein [Robertmurraya sp. DFI.2.37]